MLTEQDELDIREENIRAIRQWEKNINAGLDEQLRREYGAIVMYMVRVARFVYFNVFGRRKY